MPEAFLEYAAGVQTRRSKTALFALLLTGLAAACLGFAFLEGSSDSDVVGIVSLPIAAAATVLALIAVSRKASRGQTAWISVGIAVAYWAALAAMIVPKLLAVRR